MRVKTDVGYNPLLKTVEVDVVLGVYFFKLRKGNVVEGDPHALEMILLGNDFLKNIVSNAVAYAEDFQFSIDESAEDDSDAEKRL